MEGDPGRSQMQVVVGCADLDGAIDHFVSTVGLRLDRISPADDPREVDLSGPGVSLRLRRDPDAAQVPSLGREDLERAVAGSPLPGVEVVLRQPRRELHMPPLKPALVVSRARDGAGFGAGRAGMGYRDLIPDRLGGRFIASHIRIAEGGDVADYVHHHLVRFQMIFCYRGWVRVVYEDQGPPFVLEPGDCVLQPPGIRHRVLESSPGLEVIELSCPAEHDTFVDHDLQLPTASVDHEREWRGQRFVRHVAGEAAWEPAAPGGLQRDLGIGAATGGLAGARVLRLDPRGQPMRHQAELLFRFVLDGQVELTVGERTVQLRGADSVVIPPAELFAMEPAAPGAEILEVSLPEDWRQARA